MTDFSTLLQQGNAWLFIPSAILLGALHGLEPGHSKTMMAAFIVAVRGTVGQAVMLGLAATLSHTAVVWVVALTGMYFLGGRWDAETTEPYFQLASAVLIITIAAWMLWRTWQQQRLAQAHEHDHGHGDDEVRHIDTGHGVLRLEIFEDGVPPRFRLHVPDQGKTDLLRAAPVSYTLETERADGSRMVFTLIQRAGYLESVQEIPEPHEFLARLRMSHGDHSHDYDLEFVEHDHHHAIKDHDGLDVSAPGYQDPHELAHANDIRRRFANREVSNRQILLFGLTGGLIPCPASITVLLLCLQLKKLALGATLVMSFSVGLALTMVASGVVAAVSVRHVSRRWNGFGNFARRAPYVSGGLVMLVGLYVGYHAWHGLVG